jgi:polyisoprenoid-binding protein YceI
MMSRRDSDIQTVRHSKLPVAQHTTWAIDAQHATVEFVAKHMMFVHVNGRFHGVRGMITADEADPSHSSVEVEIDAASIDTRNAERDAYLRSADFLAVQHYPTITFRSTRVEGVENDRLQVVGELTIRGTTRQVVLETTFEGRRRNRDGCRVAAFTATTTVNRSDFGLRWNIPFEGAGLAVDHTVTIRLGVEAAKYV